MYILKGTFFLLKNFFLSLSKFYLDFFFTPFNPNKPMPNDAIYLLNEVVSILNSLKISYFITDGTILGLYRDKKLIPHDNDLDFALIDNKKLFKLFFSFIRNGWIPMRILLKEFHIYQLIFHKNQVIVDFCNWKKDCDNIKFLCPEVNGFRQQDIKFYNPTFYCLNGNNYLTHSNLEEWLEIHYGSDWRSPKRYKGNWMMDTKDIINNK